VARDHAQMNTDLQVVGGYLSPVSDEYKKPGLAPGVHRYNMCRLAVRKSSDWLMVDPWEVLVQPGYTKTADVLDHFEEEINGRQGGVAVIDAHGAEVGRRRARILLLAGSDLIQTMSEPGVWDEKDLHHILGDFGCFIVERAESEIDQSIFSSSSVHSRSPLALYRDNIFMVSQLVRNDVSSTKVRLFLRKGMVRCDFTLRRVLLTIAPVRDVPHSNSGRRLHPAARPLRARQNRPVQSPSARRGAVQVYIQPAKARRRGRGARRRCGRFGRARGF
jgi:nicotinamide mononucleotide adenylyltransferase